MPSGLENIIQINAINKRDGVQLPPVAGAAGEELRAGGGPAEPPPSACLQLRNLISG